MKKSLNSDGQEIHQ